jgi:arginine exporter protein ArgO
MTTTNARGSKTSLQRAAQAVGAVFLLVGVLGFIPGVTSNYESLGFAGHGSEALLLGIFQVSVLHNIVHLLFGVAGIALSRTHGRAKQYLLYGGIVYLVLWLYGLLIGHDSAANFVPVNSADNWLHLILGLGMIAVAILLSRNTGPARATVRGSDRGTTR